MKDENIRVEVKDNFPLKFFGDNENAFKIRIWCELIVNLPLTVIPRKIIVMNLNAFRKH
jgi:hypothetical protein